MASIEATLSGAWKFSEPASTKGGIRLSMLSVNGEPCPTFLLGPKGEYPATVPFAPSTFEGKDSSGKKTLVLNVSDEVYEAVLEMEKRTREALGVDESKWNSSVKPATAYPATLRVKYRQPLIVDEERKIAELPTPWRRLRANALIELRGAYSAPRTGSGMMLEVLQMQVRPEEEPTPASSVF